MKLLDIQASLHNHSIWSLIDSVSSPEELIKYHVERGAKYMALTDHGMISGFYHLEEAAAKYGIQHVFGNEMYVFIPELNDCAHLTLLAYNDQGKKNLLRLFHESWKFPSKAKFGKKKPMITQDQLEQFNDGLFAGTGCISSVIGRCFLKNRIELAEPNLDRLLAIFGKTRLFAEFIPHKVDTDWNSKKQEFEPNPCTPWALDGDYQKGYQIWLWNEAVLKRGLKPVTTLDAHFTTPEKKPIQDAILMNGQVGWRFARSHDVLLPEEIYNNLSYLPGFDNLLYEKMLMNGLDFCSDIKYTPTDKSVKLAFESPSVKHSLQMIGNAINIDVVNKINKNHVHHGDCCK